MAPGMASWDVKYFCPEPAFRSPSMSCSAESYRLAPRSPVIASRLTPCATMKRLIWTPPAFQQSLIIFPFTWKESLWEVETAEPAAHAGLDEVVRPSTLEERSASVNPHVQLLTSVPA